MAVSRAVEIERKYAVPEGVPLPDLGAAGATAVHPVALLEAVYFDTADRTLLGARIALRRRTGGHDAGWHAKLPGRGGRVELQAPIDPAHPDELPERLEQALRSRLRGRPLEPIARIRTERTAVDVTAGDGGVEVVDDAVTATDVAAGVVRVWREWEAEQTGEPATSAALLEVVDGLLTAAGATASPSPAKLAQALGGAMVGPVAPDGTAGAALVAMLRPLAERLHGDALGLALDGDPDGETVHDLRKSIRRLRSLLALTAVAGPAGTSLRDDLRMLGLPLGAARDPLVAAADAAALLDRVPVDAPGAAAARRRLVDAPLAAAAAGTVIAARHLGDPAALAVFDALDRYLTGAGPDGPDAGADAAVLVRLAERAVRRARRRARVLSAGEADLEALHAARKAARRVRFTVEGLVDGGHVGAKSSLAKAGARAEGVQDALGAHRDLALVAESLPGDSVAATAAGENAFALGLLAARAGQDASRLLERAVRLARLL